MISTNNSSKTVNIGIPSMIVNVKGSTEIINDILLERSSWREFKKLGKQKSDWKLVRYFLTNVDLKSVTEEVEEKLNFLIGTDAFEKIESWYKVEELSELVHFIVFPRGVELTPKEKSILEKNKI